MRRRRKTSCLRSRRSRYDLDVVDDAGRDPGRAAADRLHPRGRRRRLRRGRHPAGGEDLAVSPAAPAAKTEKEEKTSQKGCSKAKKASAGKPAGEEKPNPLLSGGVDGILELLDLGVQTLGDLRRKLRVEELTLHVCIGGSDDPAAAAMRYGRAWAAIGAITPALDRLFVIKKRDIQPALDYNETSMKVDARLITTITIGRSLALALHAGVRFLKILNQRKKAV